MQGKKRARRRSTQLVAGEGRGKVQWAAVSSLLVIRCHITGGRDG